MSKLLIAYSGTAKGLKTYLKSIIMSIEWEKQRKSHSN